MRSNAGSRVAHHKDPIAIIGIGCRFPGNANNPTAFWSLLQAGEDAITEIPANRWNIAEHYHPEPGVPGKTYSRWGGFVHGIDQFDPEAFGISPREATYMDPQQRLLLEVAWEALEDGGQVAEQLAGTRTGVFVGICATDYALIQSSPFERVSIDAHMATGNAVSIAAGRISYCLNLQGPSLAIDTACSSSLVATHLACQSLWQHESDLALAGGVNVIISPSTFVGFCAASMLSPDGRCKTFDASANGFVRGEGAGMVLLKPLSKALADGDAVYAVILATAVNQDGRTAGIAMPSQSAQTALLHEVYQQAGLAPQQVHYIEAHGTGTAVGDPIEAQALGTVLSSGRSPAQPCVIGSVKTNIGHLEAAAGIAGLLKTTLLLQHRMIPANLHFHTPNPHIAFDDLCMRVPTALEAWPDDTGPAIAGVNSFGFGGTNAHIVLKEYRPEATEQTASDNTPAARLLPLSARTPEALQALAQSYGEYLQRHDAIPLDDLCYTASTRRTHFEHRLSLVASSREAFVEHLDAFVNGERRSGMYRGRRIHGHVPKLVGVFSGQGPQWWGMGRELLYAEPVFRQTIETCDALLQPYADWSLLEELTADGSHSRLQETAIAQPAIFALQVALTALWQSWGVTFDAVVGHSVGEIAAAHIAGALQLEDAVRIIYQRGRCMDLASSKGRMLAVGVSAIEAKQVLRGYEDRVSLAALNSPTSVTVSGDPAALEEIAKILDDKGIFQQFLRVNYAFHSAQMDPVHDALLAALDGLEHCAPTLPIVSTVTGALVDDDRFDPHYWWQNVRQTVCFAPAVDRLIEQGYEAFIEVSPHPVLSGGVAQCLAERGVQGTILPSLRRQEEERATMLAALGGLYTLGYPVDWQRWWPTGGRCLHLPTYPWQRQSYWHESPSIREMRIGSSAHPLLGYARSSAEPSWEFTVDPRILRYLADHRVRQQPLFPATAYIEMGLAIAQEQLNTDTCILEDVQLHKVLFLPESGPSPALQTMYYPADASFAMYGRTAATEQDWMLHATGSMRPMPECTTEPAIDLTALQQTLPEEFSGERCYDLLKGVGLHYGPAFHGIERLWRADGEALGQIRLPDQLASEYARYCFHPAFLDSCLQVMFSTLPQGEDEPGQRLYLPVRMTSVRFYRQPTPQVWSHVRLTHSSSKGITADIAVYDADGTLVMAITGVQSQAIERTSGEATQDPEHWLYSETWYHKPRPEQPPAPRSAAAFPGPQTLVSSVAPVIMQLNTTSEWSTLLTKAIPRLDQMALIYIAQAMHELGWQWTVGERLSVEALMTQLPVAPQYQRLLRRFMQILARAGYLSQVDSESWEIQQTLPRQDAHTHWQQTLWQLPEFIAELNLLGTFGDQLAAILRGDVEPLQCLFPDGSTVTAEHVFQDAPSILPYNIMVQHIVQQALQQLPSQRPVRILEIGGGTGGLTSHVLPALPKHCTEYVFSDISSLFTTNAEQKFHDYPFVNSQLLDIEQDPCQQGYAPHTFDLILASDVLHATRDLRETLGNIQQLLASEGLLVFIETEQAPVWTDLVFGTTEGWWRFRDADLRPEYPLLTRDTWQTLLETLGWTDVAHIALPSEPEQPFKVVLLARGLEALQEAPSSRPVLELTAPQQESGSWLIFADHSGLADEVAARLRAQGETCWLVRAGDAWQRLDTEHFELSPHHPEDMERLLQMVAASDNGTWRGALHFWSLDVPPPEATTIQSLQYAEALGCHCVMHFLQALYKLEQLPSAPQLLLVTRGAQPLGASPVAIGQVPLVGLGRTIIIEYPDIRCKLVDLDPNPTADEIDHLLAELWTADADEEIAFRHEARFAPRIERAKPVKVPVAYTPLASIHTTPYCLELPTSGVLTNVTLRAAPGHSPGPGQVEIAVAAAALNFRDVMKVLGLYPSEADDAVFLGDECAGTVVAIGEGVENVQVGDEVIAMTPGSFASHVTTAAAQVVAKPAHLTFTEAVTIPVVFLTAYYALHSLARIQPGERILIHAGAGGVGLAALQIAQHMGAEVFATAGSPEKRALLTRLGVKHVMNSRSLAFFDQIMELTHGQGVDVVLNSLAGQALLKSMACLAPHGRFLELGKRDIYQNSKVGLWPFRKNIAFFSISLDLTMVEKSGLFQRMFNELMQHVHADTWRPLPHRVFPVTRMAEAFRYMAQARHIGKVVVNFQQPQVQVESPPETPMTFRADATYLITGGLGGFGLVVAKWIIERGGRHLVLMGRSGAVSEDAKHAVEALRTSGARVEVEAADVSCEEQLSDVLTRLGRTMPPLRGVFHAAMALDDDLLVQLNQHRFRHVTTAKVDGTWNLHLQTLQQPLEHFVLFSSFAALTGNPGQANYTAANAFLDAFAAYRRSLGLPGLATNWGPLSEVGYVARHQEVADYFQRVGITGFSPQQATVVLERLMHQHSVQVGMLRVDWPRWAQVMAQGKLAQRLALLVDTRSAYAHDTENGYLRQVLQRAAPQEREEIIRTYMQEQIARVLGASAAALDSDRPLNELGLDSLMAIELKNRLESDLILTLPTRELMQTPTVNRLATAVLKLLGDDATGQTQHTAPVTLSPAAVSTPVDCLVPLQPHGTRLPLFCLHPIGGQVNLYKPLIDLLPGEQPVYGLQSRLLTGAQEEYHSIADMALAYAQLIQQQQPHGPYYLLGFSFGGYLAMAITNILERQGQCVAFVGLIDCNLQWLDTSFQEQQALQTMAAGMYDLLQRELGVLQPLTAPRVAELAEIIVTTAAPQQIDAVVDWLVAHQAIVGDISPALLREYLSEFFARFESHISLIGQFQPPTVQAPLCIWWAQEELVRRSASAHQWSMYSSTTITEATVPGSHYAVMCDPYVATLAKQLVQHLYDATLHETASQ